MSCSTTVRVTNLSPKATEEILVPIFQSIGPLKGLSIDTDNNGNNIALVEFETPDAARKALEDVNGKEIVKRRINIEMVDDGRNNVRVKNKRFGLEIQMLS